MNGNIKSKFSFLEKKMFDIGYLWANIRSSLDSEEKVIISGNTNFKKKFLEFC